MSATKTALSRYICISIIAEYSECTAIIGWRRKLRFCFRFDSAVAVGVNRKTVFLRLVLLYEIRGAVCFFSDRNTAHERLSSPIVPSTHTIVSTSPTRFYYV